MSELSGNFRGRGPQSLIFFFRARKGQLKRGNSSTFQIENVKLRVNRKAVLYILTYITCTRNAGKYLSVRVPFSTVQTSGDLKLHNCQKGFLKGPRMPVQNAISPTKVKETLVRVQM